RGLRVVAGLAAGAGLPAGAHVLQLLLSLAGGDAGAGGGASAGAGAGRGIVAAGDEPDRPRARAHVSRRGQRCLPRRVSREFPADGLLHSDSVLRARGAAAPVGGACAETGGPFMKTLPLV